MNRSTDFKTIKTKSTAFLKLWQIFFGLQVLIEKLLVLNKDVTFFYTFLYAKLKTFPLVSVNEKIASCKFFKWMFCWVCFPFRDMEMKIFPSFCGWWVLAEELFLGNLEKRRGSTRLQGSKRNKMVTSKRRTSKQGGCDLHLPSLYIFSWREDTFLSLPKCSTIKLWEHGQDGILKILHVCTLVLFRFIYLSPMIEPEPCMNFFVYQSTIPFPNYRQMLVCADKNSCVLLEWKQPFG